MAKQWSVFVKWIDHKGELGVTQFRWREDGGGSQVEYSWDPMRYITEHEIKHGGTETFKGFVAFALQTGQALGGEFIMAVGCPDCGTILNAGASGCDGFYHAANQSPAMHFAQFMRQQFPDAVKKYGDDETLAAMNVLLATKELVEKLWPIAMKQWQVTVDSLRAAGLDIPTS